MVGGTPNRKEYIGSGDGEVSDEVAAVAAFFPPVEFSDKDDADGAGHPSILLGDSYTQEDVQKAQSFDIGFTRFSTDLSSAWNRRQDCSL